MPYRAVTGLVSPKIRPAPTLRRCRLKPSRARARRAPITSPCRDLAVPLTRCDLTPPPEKSRLLCVRFTVRFPGWSCRLCTRPSRCRRCAAFLRLSLRRLHVAVQDVVGAGSVCHWFVFRCSAAVLRQKQRRHRVRVASLLRTTLEVRPSPSGWRAMPAAPLWHYRVLTVDGSRARVKVRINHRMASCPLLASR